MSDGDSFATGKQARVWWVAYIYNLLTAEVLFISPFPANIANRFDQFPVHAVLLLYYYECSYFKLKFKIVYCCMQYNHFLLTCTCTQNDWTKSLKGLRPKRKVFRSPYISWKYYLEEKYLFIQVACELILTGPIGITGMSIFRMVTSCLASIKTSPELIWTKFTDSCQSSNLNQLKGHSSIKEANKCTQVDRVY